ncbi:BTAD domain-containing putative transcriptional regulator [Umezawaea sp. NPDC059074]|uniref:AfsR/SARP family transcriptional regulator n=1 Tax=Umezawaea sp. NPDC059074 TaxID=3346716 RepID=UPI0036869C41
MLGGWSFRLLGELEAVNGTASVPVRSGKSRVVLATLLLRANHTVSRDELIDRLWGDAPPARARTTVQTNVMRLRQTLGEPGLVVTGSDGYRLEVEPDHVDLHRFRALAEQACHLDPAKASTRLREALALWRGSALAGVPSESLRRDEVPRLEEERLRVLERHADLEIDLGHHGDVIGELTALTARHPYRERFWHQLMTALSRVGRQADALECYREVRARLDRELGIEPGPALQRLHTTILANDTQPRPAPPPPPTTVPRQLPADVTSFAGRENDLTTLDEMAAGPGAVVAVIHGTAGVGKTAFAVRWTHRALARFPDGQLYVDLHGFDADHAPADPGAVLARLLRSLGVDSNRIPSDTEEKGTLYRSVTADKRLLVLLDNAATANQVRPLLPGSSSCLTLVTSRNQLTGLVAVDDAHSLHLQALDAPESLLLLQNVLGPDRLTADPTSADTLVRLCGGLPLALRLVAGKLRVRTKHDLATAVAGLHQGNRLTALAVDGDPRAAIRPAFSLSYQALPPDEQHLFHHLGLIPGPDFTAAAVAALLNAPEDHTTRLLDGLTLLNLLESHVPHRYRLHDLVRLYARELSTTDTTEPLRRFYEWHATTTESAAQALYPHVPVLSHEPHPALFPTASDAWTWLESELPNLGAIIDTAPTHDMPSVAWRIADATRGFFLARTYHNTTWQAFAQGGLTAADQAEDHQAQSAMLLNLGTVHWSLCDDQGFLTYSRKAATLANTIHWQAGEAKALGNVAHALLGLGRPTEARTHGHQALTLWRTQGPSEGMTHALRIVAHMHSEAGDLHTAIHHFTEALALAKQNHSTLNELDALSGLAWAHWLQGNTREAKKLYTTTLSMSKSQGSRFREAQALAKLAEIACTEGNTPKATTLGNQALTLVRTAGRKNNEVDILNALGRIATLSAHPHTAATHHQQAITLATTPTCYHYGLTDAQVGLADAYLAQGEHEAALLEAKRSHNKSQDLGYKILQAKSTTILAETEHALSNHTQAKTYATQALTQHQNTHHHPGITRTKKTLTALR